jgi:transposase
MWTEEREAELLAAVGKARPVSQETVASAAEALDVSTRSVSAKLRKMGEEVEKVGPRSRKFSEEEEETLRSFLENNPGEFTYADIADKFAGGTYTAKQIQGKILSMELTSAVKPTPKKETQKTYSEEEEATFVKLAQNGANLEDIADALGKSLASVRGKALSLLRVGELESIPKQKESHAANKEDAFDALGDSVLDMTVEEIAEQIGKTVRGVRTLITRRGKECKNYKAKKKAS